MASLIPVVLDLIGNLIGFLSLKLKDKYNSRYLELKQQYWDEANKPEAEQDFAVMDNLQAEIKQLAQALSNQIALNK